METMYLITAVAMLGSVLGGITVDTFGGFAGLFRSYALVLLIWLIAVAMMQPPTLPTNNQPA